VKGVTFRGGRWQVRKQVKGRRVAVSFTVKTDALEYLRNLERQNLLHRHFRPALKAAGLPTTLRLYDLRHSAATLLLAARVHPKVASERLGHASITMTLDTYSHVMPDMQREASDKMEELLLGKHAQ
jgi:integrase